MVARASGPTHLADLPALGQGSEMRFCSGGGDSDRLRYTLAGESGEAAHGVEHGPGDVGGLDRLAREDSRLRSADAH